LAKFQYQSFEGISTALGSIGTVLGVGKFIPHPITQAASKVGALAGFGAAGARYVAKKYRDTYDSLEAACQQEQGPDPYQPTVPRPTGGGGGYGAGAVSGGTAPQMSWVWVSGSVTTNSAGDIIVTAGKWLPSWNPIIFDLGNDGFDFRAATDPIVADANFDGVASVRSWVGPTDGLLVYDYNQNGIGETAEWVLTSFAPGAANDLEALRAFDSNRDGSFSSGDAEFYKFRIGIDSNQDGVFSAGELHSLSQFGFNIMALTEGYDVVNRHGDEMVPGVRFDYTGNAIRTDGTYLKYAAVSFIERENQTLLLQDANATIVTQEGGRSIYWHSGSPLNVSAATMSYGGYTGFANIFGGSGNDVIHGDAGANSLYGGAGVDQLIGGEHNDVLIADAADLSWGLVDGGDGLDTLILDGHAPGAVYAVNHNVESIIGGDSNDILSGAGSAEVIYLHGGGGDDHLIGSTLGDVLMGGAGYDVLQGGDGDDMYVFERGVGTEYVDDSGGAHDVVVTRRSSYDVVQYSASGNDQVLTFNDGSRLVLANGRSGLGVEAVEFDDWTYTREDINAILDFATSGWTYGAPTDSGYGPRSELMGSELMGSEFMV
jgi:Ca2+-binding RTX toxin-like protein